MNETCVAREARLVGHRLSEDITRLTVGSAVQTCANGGTVFCRTVQSIRARSVRGTEGFCKRGVREFCMACNDTIITLNAYNN
jgi:hypothetical protein